MTALAATLQKASLWKKDLELELEELEEAATMVAEEEEEEEQGASKSAPMSRGDSSSASSDSSSSSSSSSDESEESEAEGQGCTDSKRGGGGGGGGGGGEMCKDNPPQPQPSSAASPIPQEPTSSLERKVDALPSASQGSSTLLIQELGERVAEELNISQDSGYKAERSCSQPGGAATNTEATSGKSSSGTLLEVSPRRNPLLIVQTQEDLDESDLIC